MSAPARLEEVTSAPVSSSPVTPEHHARLDGLLAATAAGDRHAFSQLYDELAPLAFSVILHILGNRTLAEEVVQEVFVEVWDKAGKFDPARGHARTWVGRLAHSRGIDKLRSVRASVERDDREHHLRERTWHLDVEEEALRHVESEQLRAAVDAVGEPHSTALRLAFFAGLSHSELAESTGVPLGTAKTRVRDGLKKLAAIVGTTHNMATQSTADEGRNDA